MKCAVVDIGSNTMRMNIYSVVNNEIDLLFKKKQFASLASYNEKGMLTKDGIKTLINTLSTFKNDLSKIKVKNMYIFATASIRNVENSDEILKVIKKKLDLDIDLISGKREAYLGFVGLEKELKKKEGINFDVGGGSTEIFVYENDEIKFSDSIDEGSLSLYSKYVTGVIPNTYEAAQISEIVRKSIEQLNIKDKKIPKHVTAIGGTARALAKLVDALKVEEQDNEIKQKDLKEMIGLITKGDIFLRKNIVRLLPERIHTITTGMIIYNVLCEELNIKNIKVSKNGIREGYLDLKLNGEKDEK